jgi:hypothetical protein
MTEKLTKFFDTLGNMGVWIRLNDSHTQPPAEKGRIWGASAGGFALSIAAHDADSLSILIKNLSDTELRAQLPGWLHLLQVQITGPDGSSVPLKPYGIQIMKDPRIGTLVERAFGPCKYLATDIPIGALYDMHSHGTYRVRVSCPVPGGKEGSRIDSNEVTVNL